MRNKAFFARTAAAAMALSASGFAFEANIVAIGQRIEIGASLARVDATAPAKLRARTGDWYPYAAVARFPAEAGSRYTLIAEYPADGASRRIMICGDNPLRDDRVSIPAGADVSFLTDLSGHAGSGCRETRRYNFTVDPRSPVRGLFLIVMAHQASAPIAVTLRFPAVPDTDVKNPSEMPGCPKIGKIHWGAVLERPIVMTAAGAGPGPAVKPVPGGVHVEIKPVAGIPLPQGGAFTVPNGMMAVNFHAANQINDRTKSWKIFRTKPVPGTVYEYGFLFDLQKNRDVEVDKPPLRTLKLSAGSYDVYISGTTGSLLMLDYDLMPVTSGPGRL